MLPKELLLVRISAYLYIPWWFLTCSSLISMSHRILLPTVQKLHKANLPCSVPSRRLALRLTPRPCLSPDRVPRILSSQKTSINMVARTPPRLTRSSPSNIKKFEFDRIYRSQQRLLFRNKRSSRAPAPEPKPPKKVSFLLPEPRNKCDGHQQQWRKALRSRTHNRRGSSNPHVQSKQKPGSPNLASSERFQECSICAVQKGK